MPTIAIAIIIAIAAMIVVRTSVEELGLEVVEAGGVVGVTDAATAARPVAAEELPYEFVPAKEAVIV